MEAASLIYTGHMSDSIQGTDYITNDYIVISSWISGFLWK